VRVLLTGHEGYIGTVLAPLLMRAGHEVVGLDSGLFVDCTYAGDVAAIPSIEKDTRDVAREDLAGLRRRPPLGRVVERPRSATSTRI
jgi:nucleoside-diphosphate-sugar epimerase